MRKAEDAMTSPSEAPIVQKKLSRMPLLLCSWRPKLATSWQLARARMDET